MVGVFTFGLIFVLNHMEKLGAAHTTITYPSSWFLKTQDDLEENVRVDIKTCVPGTGADLLLSWFALLFPCKCLAQFFFCTHVTYVTIDYPQNFSQPFVCLVCQGKPEKRYNASLYLLPAGVSLHCWVLLTVFKTDNTVEFALEAVPLCASVIHEPLSLRGVTHTDSAGQNNLYKTVWAGINKFTLFLNHLKDKDPV